MPLKFWVPPGSFQEARQFVETMGLPYELKETSSSQSAKNAKVTIRTSAHYLGRGILGHLVNCKAEILKNAKTKELLIPERLSWYGVSDYFSMDLPPRKMFVSEFDLNHAYWAVALRLGFIGKKTFEKFLRFKTKHFRLIALGMLARREYVRKFDKDGHELESKVNVDEVGTQIFRRIAYEVTKEMQRLSLKYSDEFRFYWFDNIVFSTMVRELQTEYSYRQKDETLRLLFVPHKKIILDLGGREFSFPLHAAFKNGDVTPVSIQKPETRSGLFGDFGTASGLPGSLQSQKESLFDS